MILLFFSTLLITPTYRYFLGPKDICVFLAYHKLTDLVILSIYMKFC